MSHAYAPASALPESDERNAATLAHLSVFSILLGLPLGNLLGPLIVLLVKRGESDFVVRHCKAVLNFQITLCVGVLTAALAAAATVPQVGPAVLVVLVPLGILGALLSLVFTVIGAVRAKSGEEYRYPLALPWI
ncbi:MAG: DUF4870 domain-containing protein [Planctomycetota bacterium]